MRKIHIILFLSLIGILIFVLINNTYKENFIQKCNCSEGFYCSDGECISKCGDAICVGNENKFCCKDCIEELEIYPKELRLAFLDSEFSNDCKLQKDEKTALDYALLLFQYYSLEYVKNNISEINGWKELFKALYFYNPYSKSKEKDELFNNIFKNSSLEEKEKAYIIQLAHILWLEGEKIVRWSLKDYSKEEIVYLLDGDNNTEWSKTVISREWYKAFPIAFNLTKEMNEKEAVEKIVGWETKNFFHAYKDYGWEVYGKGLTLQTLEDVFRERVISCHTASHILISMLRSINIPAYEKHFKEHGVVFIPTLNLYVHGDYIAKFAANPNLLMTKQELESYVNSERGYRKFQDESLYRFVELKRDGNKLYISGTISDEADIDFVIRSLEEYSITLEKSNIGWLSIKSDKVEIKKLDDF